VPIHIPTGCMVAFRGDYVHGGTCYDHNHTRIFMGLTIVEESSDINTTHLEDDKKNPPPEITGEEEDVEVGVGRSRAKVSRKNKKRKVA
jgi:hypothetical protein